MTKTAIIIHGGAWDIPDDALDAHKDGLQKALDIAISFLQHGESAIDVVEAAITEMENHPAFDAGYGSVLNEAGEVEMDAGIMDGGTLDFGSIAGVKKIKNPISVAKHIAQNGHGKYCFLVGDAADRYAEKFNFQLIENQDFIVERERRLYEQIKNELRYHTSHPFRGKIPGDTVGAVALDLNGRIAAGTSTGGAPFKIPGRIGDSPIPGAGFYATAEAGASATGWGEAISKSVVCYQAVQFVQQNLSTSEASMAVIQRMAQQIKDPDGRGAAGGVIVLNNKGESGFYYNTPRMARAGWDSETKKIFMAI